MEDHNNVIAMLSRLISEYGIKHVISSPGSRSFPLLTAFARNHDLQVKTIVDERSAAFSALGIAETTGLPVCLLCTSGSAVLNYAPAVAEAYYRNIPLIVVSADRPSEWIGQNDGQTIVQPRALNNVVAASFDISADDTSSSRFYYANRTINEALTLATLRERRPIHLNVHIGEPMKECEESAIGLPYRKIRFSAPEKRLSTQEVRRMGVELASPIKVMIFVGQIPPDRRLNKALVKLSQFSNIVVIGQNVSNIHCPHFINSIDSIISQVPTKVISEMLPDVLITIGGGITSRIFKEFLRNKSDLIHWNINPNGDTVDCFMKLNMTIAAEPGLFFQQLASAMQPHKHPSDYAAWWQLVYRDALDSATKYAKNASWSDLKAIHKILTAIPSYWNVQCSNGMSIRYCDLFDCSRFHRFTANRGVNGIDGSTSTAIGASSVFPGTTLLITGDMSALYDVSAFMSPLLSDRFKMIVLDNNGGDIFRCIKATRNVAEREQHISCGTHLPARQLAEAAGMAFFEVTSEDQFNQQIKQFISEAKRPALMVISTPHEHNATVYSEYLKRNKNS